MVFGRVHFAFCVILVFESLLYCDGQTAQSKSYDLISPLPFPTCRADNVDCLRRSLRTFLFLMDAGHFGMKPVDPAIVNSVSLSLPEQQMTFSLRRVNVTGIRWTKLAGRRFDLEKGKNGVTFISDLHLAGQISMEVAGSTEPRNAYITMDIHGAESNITYEGVIQQGTDYEDYIVIGPERIAVRNRRLPTYFLQPNSEDSYIIDDALLKKPSILDHFSNEIVAALMHAVVDNFRLFSMKVPIKHYYKYYSE